MKNYDFSWIVWLVNLFVTGLVLFATYATKSPWPLLALGPLAWLNYKTKKRG